MGKKYVMTGSFLDGFKASFTKKECILAEKHYPLGYFAVEFLEVDRTLLRELERLVPIFQEELTVFLSIIRWKWISGRIINLCLSRSCRSFRFRCRFPLKR